MTSSFHSVTWFDTLKVVRSSCETSTHENIAAAQRRGAKNFFMGRSPVRGVEPPLDRQAEVVLVAATRELVVGCVAKAGALVARGVEVHELEVWPRERPAASRREEGDEAEPPRRGAIGFAVVAGRGAAE